MGTPNPRTTPTVRPLCILSQTCYRTRLHTSQHSRLLPCSTILPALSTLTKALKKGYLPPLPGLTETLLRKYPPDLEATTMGHLDNRRKNIQSTKTKRVTFPDDQEEDPFPEQPKDNNRTNFCFLTTTEPKHIVYTDQTGRLPQPSSSGNNYLLIAYDYASNSILLRPYKNKTAQVLTDTIAQVHDTLTQGGCRPLFHRLDNECPGGRSQSILQGTNGRLPTSTTT